LLRIIAGHIAFETLSFFPLRAWFQGCPKGAGIEHDDLNPLPMALLKLGEVDSGSHRAWIVGNYAPELFEKGFRVGAQWEFGSTVIAGVVVIIPGWKDRDLFAELLKLFVGREEGVGQAEFGHSDFSVIANVSVDAIAHKEKELRLMRGDLGPETLCPLLMSAGAERDGCGRGLAWGGDGQYRMTSSASKNPGGEHEA